MRPSPDGYDRHLCGIFRYFLFFVLQKAFAAFWLLFVPKSFAQGRFWGFRTEKKLGRIPPLLMKLKFLIFTFPISALSAALLACYYLIFDPSALGVIREILLTNTLQSWTVIIGIICLFHLGIVLMSFRYSGIDHPDQEYWRRQSKKWGFDKMSKRTYWIIVVLLCIIVAALIYHRIYHPSQ